MSSEDFENPWASHVRAIAREARREIDQHPTPGKILAYHAGELGDKNRKVLQRHLALCPDCVQTLLDLDSFPRVAATDGQEPQQAEKELSWEALVARIEAPGREDHEGAATAVLAEGARLMRDLRRFQVLAAAMLVAVLGFGFWSMTLRRQLATLTGPQGNVLVHDLLPESEGETRSAAGLETITLPPHTWRLVLILDVGDLRPFPDYRLDVGDRSGHLRWRVRGLRRMPEGSFSVELPLRAGVVGDHRLELFGLGQGEAVLLATYDLRVDRAPER